MYRHDGFPTHDGQGNLVDRCTLCGGSGHKCAECVALGGGKDPQMDIVAEAYSEREKLYDEQGGKSKTKGKVDEGKVKVAGKHKGKNQRRQRR